MKKIFLILLFLIAFIGLKAQYHLLYFSDDSIPRLKIDAADLFMHQKYEESSKIYRKLSIIDSLKAYSCYKIGINYREINKIDSSFFYLNKALKFGYDSLRVYDVMVYIYNTLLNERKKAYDLMTEMIGYWPKNAKLYRERATYRDYADTKGYLSDLKKAGELGDEGAKHSYENFYLKKATLEKNLKAQGLK